MSRRARLHVAGGIYYVIQRSGGRQPIFADASHYAMFERLLAISLERCRARVHAYCWLPDTIHLILQVGNQPAGRLMQRLTSQYSRRVHSLSGESGHLFRQRYQALLIDPEVHLLPLLQQLHLLPVSVGHDSDINEYPWSSHRAYLGTTRIAWLTTHMALKRLDRRPDTARRRYLELMAERSSVAADRLLRGSSADPRVLGDTRFLAGRADVAVRASVRATAGSRARSTADRQSPQADSLERLIEAVTRVLGMDRSELLSRSRRRRLALARALIAWHATERGEATLAEVGRRLQRDPSTLIAAVNRHRALRPDLFDLAALPTPGPLLRRLTRET